jgi:hypothetical protein
MQVPVPGWHCTDYRTAASGFGFNHTKLGKGDEEALMSTLRLGNGDAWEVQSEGGAPKRALNARWIFVAFQGTDGRYYHAAFNTRTIVDTANEGIWVVDA